MTTNWKVLGSRPERHPGRTRRRRALVLGLSMIAAAAAVVQPLSPAPTATAAAVGEVREGGPVILDGTDSGLHGSIVLDGTGEPKASELRSTWIYALKAWETLLAGVADGYAHNGKVALVGATPSAATGNDCGAMAGYVAERLASGPITVDYFEGATAIGELFDGVLAGTQNYQMIHIVESVYCSNGMSSAEETVVAARGPAISAHVNRGGALFAQFHNYGWLSDLFPTLSASTSCSGSTPALTDAGYAQFPGLSNSDIAAPWHNCFVDSSGTFPLTQLALQDGTHTVILGGDSVSLPSSVTVTTTPEQPRPGEEVCATATVTDGPGGAPVEGASVDFSVDGVLVATVLTDAGGVAQYCYIAEESGEDDVTATVSTGTGTGTGTTTVTWSDVALSATPSASQPRGNEVCVVAAVASVTGETTTPASGVTVDFTVAGVNTPAPASVVTDGSGNAQYCYDGVNGGEDIVTASLGGDERGILITWSGARVEIVDVSQPAGGSGKVVPISVDEFTGATDLFVTLSLPADSGTLSVDATGLTLTFSGGVSSGATVEFSGAASAVTTALGSRVTWAAPATPGDVTMTAVVADAATSPTMSATDTGTLTVTAPPAITTQPESATVDSGATATFTSEASGSPAPSATWQVSTDDGATWANLAGATSGTLAFTTSNDMDGNQYRVKWTNSVGNVTSSAVTLTVNPAIAPELTDTTLGTIVVGTAFVDGVSATGAPAPTYSIAGGALPDGLVLDEATGAITGTATAGGSYSVTITAANSAGTDSVLLTGTVESAPGAFSVTTLGSLVEGTAVSVTLSVPGQPAPTYAVSDGQLPAGLTLDPATGAITGTPTAAGPYQVTITATNAHGTSSQVFEGTVVVADGGFLGMEPVRLLDSRVGSRLAADSTHEVLVVDHGVPADATSVVLNVTVVRPQEAGYLTVFPCGIDRPLTSNVNFVAGATVANQVTAKVGTDGEVCFFTTAATDLVVDVNGAYSASAGTGHLKALTPNRLFDSRESDSKVAAEAVTELLVTGRGGVPADATSVVLNVTATQGDHDGYVVVFPCGGDVPLASNVNFLAGQTVPNAVTAAVGEDGKVCLYSTATTHLVVDVNGAYSPTEGQGAVVPLTPARLLDTRLGGEKVVALDVYDLAVGAQGVPTGATAVMLNVTVAQPETAGFVTVFPCGAERPLASHVNFVAGRNTANAVTAAVGDDGTVCLYSTSTTHLVVDVSGAQQS